VLCEIQHTLKDSSKQLIWDKIKELGLEDFYTSSEQEIRGKNGTVFWFAGLRTHSTGSAAENLKSKEGVDLVSRSCFSCTCPIWPPTWAPTV
jgi:phage terminase large subunit